MANVNKFFPFANAGGANVITDDAYSGLPARQAGFVQGLAPSNQLNKAWRQSGLWAAVLGQFTADYGPSDVNDALSIAALEGYFLAAMRAAVTTTPAPGIPYEGTDTGMTANAVYVATTNPTSAALTAGQVFIVTKNSSSVTGATTFKNGSNNPAPVKTLSGGDLVANDWQAYQPALLYIVNLSGTLTAVMMTLPRVDVAQTLATSKVLTNVQMFVHSTRVVMSAQNGASVSPISGWSYQKKSDTSRLFVLYTPQTYDTYYNTGGGYVTVTLADLAIGSVTLEVTNFAGSYAYGGAQTVMNRLVPSGSLLKGTYTITPSFRRADNLLWYDVLNPTTTDYSGLPSSTSTNLIIGEIEP